MDRKIEILHSWAVVLPKFPGRSCLLEKRQLPKQICLLQGILKGERPHFRLTYVPQNLLCLSSLLYVLTPPPP